MKNRVIPCRKCGMDLQRIHTQEIEEDNVTVVIYSCPSCKQKYGSSYKIKGNVIEFIDMLVEL